MTKGRSDEPGMPDFGELAEDMEEAMAQARKATDNQPPLEELAGLQEAMAGLARMGTVVEKMRLAAEQHEELVAELVGEPDWRVEAAIEVKKGASSLMGVELTADFDLEIILQAHEILRSREAQAQVAATLERMGLDLGMVHEEIARGRGMALIRELNLVEPRIAPVVQKRSEELPLAPEANVPLKVSDERELCFEFAPTLTLSVPRGDPDSEKLDLPDFAPTIDEVRVDLDSFEPGTPFEHSLTVSQEELRLELKLVFRPL
jgi:hypothetical protein